MALIQLLSAIAGTFPGLAMLILAPMTHAGPGVSRITLSWISVPLFLSNMLERQSKVIMPINGGAQKIPKQ